MILSELDVNKTESIKHSTLVAEKLRAILNKPYVLNEHLQEGSTETAVEHHCTTSIGVVLFLDHSVSQNDLLKWADTAMYEAKEAGRNSIRFYKTNE